MGGWRNWAAAGVRMQDEIIRAWKQERIIPTGAGAGKWYWRTHFHFLSTDMHGADVRTPDCEMTLAWLRKRAGEERIRELTIENPGKLLDGLRI